MRTTALFLFVLCLPILSQPQQPPDRSPATKTNNIPTEKDKKTSGKLDQPTEDKATIQIQADSIEIGGDTKTKADDELNINRQLVWFTAGLVIVGALQTGALIWQATVLHEHSGHLRDSVAQTTRTVSTYRRYVAVAIISARAAKASTEALISIERPWIKLDGGPKEYNRYT